jgi:hypothetical protein
MARGMPSEVVIAIPIAMIGSTVSHLRTPPSKRTGGGAMSSAVGAALLEADRLLTRPSAEHTIEAQHQLPRQDDNDDDN